MAAVVGVPISLQLSLWGGWRLPFVVVGMMGLLVTALVTAALPSLRDHLARRSAASVAGPLFRPLVVASYAMTAVTMAAGFLVIPNLSAYVQENLGFPRSQLQWMYFFGGLISFVTLRAVGKLVDRWGSFPVGTVASLLLVVAFDLLFVHVPRSVPVAALFLFIFFALSSRNVAYNTLTSKVPEPGERARFMSFQSAVQHLASALGAGISSEVLFVQPDGRLGNVPTLGRMAMATVLLLPPLLFWVERGVRRRPPGVPPGDPFPGGMARTLEKV